MSYGFNMFFKQVESKTEAFEFGIKIMNNLKENAEEYIRNYKYHIPSHRDFLDVATNPNSYKQADEYWLYMMFVNNFIYWEEEKLVGMFGERLPKETAALFDTEVYFQDSTDQNYDYETWGDKISYFKEIINRVQSMKNESLLEVMKQRWHYDEDEVDEIQEMRERIEKDSLYYRQSAVYEIIFDELDLGTWMDDGRESDKFTRFNLCSINGGDEYFKLKTILKVIKMELKKEEEKDEG